MMLSLPVKYKVGKKIPLKDLIPKKLKPNEKRKIKSFLKKAVLTYQIAGEEIPSVHDDIYHYQVIQYYDFELEDIKQSSYMANVYQPLIKSPCVIRFFDFKNEMFSLALKRLNQVNSAEVVISDFLNTETYQIMLPNSHKQQLFKLLDYENMINRENKVTFYQEMYVKAFIQTNSNLYHNATSFLDAPIWYDKNKVAKLYSVLKEIKSNYEQLKKTNVNAEKMKINQKIRTGIEALDNL